MKGGRFFSIMYLSLVISFVFVSVIGVYNTYAGGYGGKEDVSGTLYIGEEEVSYDPCGDVEIVANEPAAEPTIVREIEPSDEEFTQNNLAKMIARVLGLEDRLPAAVSIDDYFNLLTVVGIAPLDGWQVDEAVTRDDLAVVMVQSLGLQGEVEDTLDTLCYVDVLRSEGVDMTKGIFNVEHGLSFPTVVSSFDALKFGSTVSDNFQTSLSPIDTSVGY